jgi:hypothetical protein
MKKLLTGFLCLFACTLVSQNAWEQLNDFPFEMSVHVSFATATHGYVMTHAFFGDNRIFQYDPDTDLWVQKGDFPIASVSNYSEAVLDGVPYVLTGDDNTSEATLWKYNEGDDSWEAAATDFFSEGFGFSGFFGAAFANHGKIYVHTSSFNDNFRSYDPVTDTWEILQDSPAVGQLGTEGFSIGDRSYFIFSTKEFAGPDSKDLWELDFDTGEWIAHPPYPGFTEPGFEYPETIFEIDGFGYVGMTYLESNFHRFNGDDGSWETIQACGYFGDRAAGFSINGIAYVAGGSALDPNSGASIHVKDVWRLDPDLLAVDGENISEFTLSPNPAITSIKINGVPTDVAYGISTVQGKLISSGISENRSIDVSLLPAGIYFVSITSEEKITVKKLLKL